MMDASHDPEVVHAALENDCLSQCPSKPFVPLLGGPDHVVAIVHLDDPPAQTALFSRRELRRALKILDGFDPDDQRIELALLEASAPVLVARPYDPTGEGWVAVAGHSEVAGTQVSAPKPKEEKPKAKTDNFDTGFPGKPAKVPVKVDPAPEAKPKAPEPKPAPKKAEEKPAAPAAEDVCEECGGPVSKTQKQMSQLFLNKTLCKECLDKLSGGQA